ncbi:MAG: hypothetical protein VYC34_08160 [Planctomycetota bacterium]|nr:hypothetical protein [Planctomycetota bacterium]
MMSQGKSDFRKRMCLVATAAIVAAAAGLTGCGKEEEAAAPPPPAPKPVVTVDPLADVVLDPRVEFPKERAPNEPGLAKAIGNLASAIAAGDAESMKPLLDEASAALLDEMVDRGVWEESTSNIEVVRIAALEGGAGGAKVGLAVQDPKGAYLLAWEGLQRGSDWVFSGLAVDAPSVGRASELDGVALATDPLPVPGADGDLTLEELEARRRAEEREQAERGGNRRGSRSSGSSGGGRGRGPFSPG